MQKADKNNWEWNIHLINRKIWSQETKFMPYVCWDLRVIISFSLLKPKKIHTFTINLLQKIGRRSLTKKKKKIKHTFLTQVHMQAVKTNKKRWHPVGIFYFTYHIHLTIEQTIITILYRCKRRWWRNISLMHDKYKYLFCLTIWRIVHEMYWKTVW